MVILSDKTDRNSPEEYVFRSNRLSLELLGRLLANPGPALRETPRFIDFIRTHLCPSLVKNGASTTPEIFKESLKIFLSLFRHYRQHLKIQMGIFLQDVFLRLLGSGASSFEHKWLAVTTLQKICADAQMVVDIYLNYDCDMNLPNVFHQIIEDCSKLARGRAALELGAGTAPQQVKDIRICGLRCLVSTLQCMVDWSSDLYVNVHNQSNLASDNNKTNAGDNQLDGEPTKEFGVLGRFTSHSSLNSQASSGPVGTPAGSMLHSVGSTSAMAIMADSPQQFEHIKQRKELMEQGIELFRRKPAKGIQFLQEHQLVGPEIEDVAEFLHREERLDRTAIGELLGDADKTAIKVMYAYIDQINFKEMDLVAALRHFLDGFRLPGEAQKIDRLMEKFAGRYCECNPTETPFASADVAYVLAYSIIMLTTDLHSAQVKTKMTKEQYIKMNRGINNEKDLPEEYLSQIYDEIAHEEIKMKGATGSAKDLMPAVSISERQRRTLFSNVAENVAQSAICLMESLSHVKTDFTQATHLEHVRPMFKNSWASYLTAFSMGLQDCDDSTIAGLCLEGFQHCTRIACIFRMEMERNMYVQALSQFTMLQIEKVTTGRLTEMKAKNVDTIKALIYIAIQYGNYLGDAWFEILKCVSHLEVAQLLGVNARHGAPPAGFGDTSGSRQTSAFSGMTAMGASFLHPRRQGRDGTGGGSSRSTHSNQSSGSGTGGVALPDAIGETASQHVVVAVDRIFTGSVKLDGEAIVDFVAALCKVSDDELKQPEPRMFSLQKIVEISYYNMGRIRLVWSRMWAKLGEHFNRAGCSSSLNVAEFAVDSLRQLSTKFIEKGELANFRFQKDFLKPFEHIMKRNNSTLIRQMVLLCVDQLCTAQARNLRSGWNNIFSVYSIAASLHQQNLVFESFLSVTRIVKDSMEKHLATMVDSFQDCVKCLSEFSCNQLYPDTCMEAIRLIRDCADLVANRPQYFSDSPPATDAVASSPVMVAGSGSTSGANQASSPAAYIEGDKVWLRGWLPILCQLHTIISRCHLDIRTRALTVLFEILKTFGSRFEQRWWSEVFNIVFRIFDSIKSRDATDEIRREWMETTCNHALYSVVDVFTVYFGSLSELLLDDLYLQLEWCATQQNEQIAKSALNCLETFVLLNHSKLTPTMWNKTVRCIENIYEKTKPKQLLDWLPAEGNLLRPPPGVSGDAVSRTSIFIMCMVQQELVQTIDNLLFSPNGSRREDERFVQRLANDPLVARLAASAPHAALPATPSTPASPTSSAPSIHTVPSGGEQLAIESRELRASSFTSTGSGYNDDKPPVAVYDCLNAGQLLALVKSLTRSYEFSFEFHSNQAQIERLWRANFSMQANSKPNLKRQEFTSLLCALRILFRLCFGDCGGLSGGGQAGCPPSSPTSGLTPEVLESTRSFLLETCVTAVTRFTHLSSGRHRDIWFNVLLVLLTNVNRLASVGAYVGCFQRFATALYQPLCDLIVVEPRIEIKLLLREFFQLCGGLDGVGTAVGDGGSGDGSNVAGSFGRLSLMEADESSA